MQLGVHLWYSQTFKLEAVQAHADRSMVRPATSRRWLLVEKDMAKLLLLMLLWLRVGFFSFALVFKLVVVLDSWFDQIQIQIQIRILFLQSAWKYSLLYLYHSIISFCQ